MAKLSKNEKKQFFSGFFITFVWWLLGIFASGCILFVEMIKFYNVSPVLSVVFSILFLIFLIITSVKCASKRKKSFFIGMMFAVVFPGISQLIAAGVFSLTETIGSMGASELILVPLTIAAFLFIAPAFPISSVNYQWSKLDIGEEWPEYAFFAVMLITIVLPIVVYLIVSKKKNKT